MIFFKDLSFEEKEALLKFPVYISLLAAEKNYHLDKKERKEAIRFNHIETYSCDPLLSDFYKEADKEFVKNLTKIDEELPKEKEQREAAIQNELLKLENILLKMDKQYATVMHRSMLTFKDHVSKAHRNVLEYFLFPLPFKGISD